MHVMCHAWHGSSGSVWPDRAGAAAAARRTAHVRRSTPADDWRGWHGKDLYAHTPCIALRAVHGQ